MSEFIMWVLVAILSLVLAIPIAYVVDKIEQKFNKCER